jgi:hypothetical protein
MANKPVKPNNPPIQTWSDQELAAGQERNSRNTVKWRPSGRDSLNQINTEINARAKKRKEK